MPLKIYCPNPNCSSPIEYTLQKPVCCPYCRTDLDASFGATPKPVAATRPVQQKKELEVIVDEVDIDASHFGVEIESYGDNKGVKLGSVAEQQKTGFVREVPKRINVKKAMASILEEAKKPARIEIGDTGAE